MSSLSKNLNPITKNLLDNAPHIIAWFIDKNLMVESGKPFDFIEHYFMVQILQDFSNPLTIKKSAQNGLSVAHIGKETYAAAELGMNVAHILPTRNVVDSFVVPKVDPIIAFNPYLKGELTIDNKGTKKFRNNFVFYKGSHSEADAINFSADIIIRDERDRLNQKIAQTFISRMQHSEHRLLWDLSNPSEMGYGVDMDYQASDQMHWFITCDKCNHEWYIDWESEDSNCHYVNVEGAFFACGKCHKELSHKARCFGRWVPKHPARHGRGYWMSQLMCPWVPARDIIRDSSTDPYFFHNFVLGKAYTPTDLLVDRQAILRATSPGTIAQENVVMGVDNGIVKHYVIGTPNGIFRYGDTKDWDEIRSLIRLYNMSCVVIDHNPYPVEPKRLVKEFPGKVFLNFYEQDKTGLSTIRWVKDKDYGIIKADRTKIIDQVASEIAQAKLIFRQSPYELEEYIAHWASMYRQVVENTQGIKRGEWLHQEGKPDHLAHATIYFRIALEKAFGGFGQVVKRSNFSSDSRNLTTVNADGSMKLNLDFKKAYAKKRTIR